MFHGDQLVAVTDWELAHWGDVHDDLAWVLVRDTLERFPDVDAQVRTTSLRERLHHRPGVCATSSCSPSTGRPSERWPGCARGTGGEIAWQLIFNTLHMATRGALAAGGSEHRHVRHRARRRRRTLVGLRHRARRPARRRAPRRRRRLRRDAPRGGAAAGSTCGRPIAWPPGSPPRRGGCSSVTRSTTSRPGAPLCAGRSSRARSALRRCCRTACARPRGGDHASGDGLARRPPLHAGGPGPRRGAAR